MPLTQARLNEVMQRLRASLVNRHPNWQHYLDAIERFSAARVVDTPPPPIERHADFTPGMKVRVRAALSAADQALLDEILP